MKYRKTLLTYIDYLGFKELVCSKENPEKIYQKLSDFIQPLQGFLFSDPYYDKFKLDNIEKRKKAGIKEINSLLDITGMPLSLRNKDNSGDFSTEFYFFSDTVIRVNDIEPYADKEIGLFLQLEIDFLLHALLTLLEKRFLTRGIITMGNNFQSKKVYFGPTLIRAYELESKKVIYPRICLDRKISDDIFYNDNMIYDKINLSKMLTQDFDGMFFIDYLKFICLEWLDLVDNYSDDHADDLLTEVFAKSKLSIENELKNIKEIYETKIFWLKNYHNRTLIRFSKDIKEKSHININDYLIEN
ncbi:MAG: hypothetical protein LBH43_16505 [Treponema sp.]|jgi:hypothetical protein|nr:hypothetical protein [Treponema sp.]